MKWVLILAIWNTTPPQDSFKFLTETYSSQEECQEAIQAAYAVIFNKGGQGQAVCMSEAQLGLTRSFS